MVLSQNSYINFKLTYVLDSLCFSHSAADSWTLHTVLAQSEYFRNYWANLTFYSMKASSLKPPWIRSAYCTSGLQEAFWLLPVISDRWERRLQQGSPQNLSFTFVALREGQMCKIKHDCLFCTGIYVKTRCYSKPRAFYISCFILLFFGKRVTASVRQSLKDGFYQRRQLTPELGKIGQMRLEITHHIFNF